MAKSSLAWGLPLTYAILVSAMPGSPVNWYTTSSAILWASRRPSAAGRAKRLVALGRCSGRVGGAGGAAPPPRGRSGGGPGGGRPAPATSGILLGRPWVSRPATSVNSGMTMLSFFAPPAMTFRNTSTAWEPAGRGVARRPASATAPAATRARATVGRRITASARLEVEPEVHAERLAGGSLRQRGERGRLHDGPERRLGIPRVTLS